MIEQPKPKYIQLKDLLIEEILGQSLAPGSRMDSLFELVRKYSVSTTTAEKAISCLINEGWVYRHQGKGTFVADYRAARAQDRILGAIMADRATPNTNTGEALMGIEEAASARDYGTMLSCSKFDASSQLECVDKLRQSSAGLVISPPRLDSPDSPLRRRIVELREAGYPVVFLDCYIEDMDCSYVTTDNAAAAHSAVEHLVNLGHRAVGCICRYYDILPTAAADRIKGYMQAVEDFHLRRFYSGLDDMEITAVSGSTDDLEPYKRVLKTLIQKNDGQLPIAVLCCHSESAIAAIRAAGELGLRVPEDLAVVSFDEVPSLERKIGMHLTSIVQPMREIGKRAAELLIDDIEGRSRGSVHLELPARIVIGDTCGARLAGLQERPGVLAGV